MKKTLWWIVGIVVLIGIADAVCILYPRPHVAGSFSDLKNGTYTVDGTTVTLDNGVATTTVAPGSASVMTTQYFGNEAVGDLNNDGKADTALLLAQDGGGTGVFYFVTAALATSSGYTSTNAVFLGDRIAPQTTEIHNGIITVNYADRAPGEPFSAEPSVGVSKYFKVVGTTLVEASSSSVK